MKYEKDTYYVATRAVFSNQAKIVLSPPIGSVVLMEDYVYREGLSGRGWYAKFTDPNKKGYYIRVSTKKKLGPNAFRKASGLEALGSSLD